MAFTRKQKFAIFLRSIADVVDPKPIPLPVVVEKKVCGEDGYFCSGCEDNTIHNALMAAYIETNGHDGNWDE